MNAQQFDKIFLAESFPNSKGTRWKVKGSPGGGGGLDYVGDNVEDYKRRYEIKSDDSPAAWKALIELCKTLSETSVDRLEEALKPILDIDGALWFLAIDNALVNNDGYWIRASDYSLFRDANGKFHVIPHDTNETFQSNAGFGPPGGGFGRGGGQRRGPGGGAGFGRGGGPAPGSGPAPGGGPGRGPGASPVRRAARRASSSIRWLASMTPANPCAVACWPCPRSRPGISTMCARSPRTGSIGTSSNRSSINTGR